MNPFWIYKLLFKKKKKEESWDQDCPNQLISSAICWALAPLNKDKVGFYRWSPPSASHLSSSPLCLSLSCLFLSLLFARKTQCFSWLPESWLWQMRGECERWGGEKGNRVARRVFRSLLDKRMCSYNVVAADKSLKSCLCSADKEPPPPLLCPLHQYTPTCTHTINFTPTCTHTHMPHHTG